MIKPRELSGNIISIKSLAQHLQIIDGYRYVNLRVHPQILRRKNYNVATERKHYGMAKILELINLHITLHVALMIILAIILTYNIYGTETPLPALYMD